MPGSARSLRPVWLLFGLICVALGSVGVVVPGLPTTIFFILAAASFARSSPRLERWVLGLPGIGKSVGDYRAGRGMPLRAKAFAIASIVGFSALAVVFFVESLPGRVVIVVAALIGVAYLSFRVPVLDPNGPDRPTG